MLPPETTALRSSSRQHHDNQQPSNANNNDCAGSTNFNNSNSNGNINDDDYDDLHKYSIHYDSNSTTTFRNDVRNDWVDAIFGKEYFPTATTTATAAAAASSSTTSTEENKTNYKGNIIIAVRQGVGAAGIPHHVTYGAVLSRDVRQGGGLAQPTTMTTVEKLFGKGNGTATKPAGMTNATSTTNSTTRTTTTSSSDSTTAKTSATTTATTAAATKTTTKTAISSSASSASSQQPPLQSQPSFTKQQKLGITITRIPLGVYVHAIALDSEAYAAGISPGSILVDINGALGLLGERSDRALERLWRYAGLFAGSGDGGSSSGDENSHNGTNNTSLLLSSSSSLDNTILKNSIGHSSKSNNIYNNRGSSNGSGTKEHPLISSTTSASCKNNNLQVKKSMLLRFYKSGTIYQTILLSGKPLRGIHWAPCGNFALVHKVSPGSIAAEAGVRRGSLVVGVNSLGLRSLDHGGVARCLKDKFMNDVSSSYYDLSGSRCYCTCSSVLDVDH